MATDVTIEHSRSARSGVRQSLPIHAAGDRPACGRLSLGAIADHALESTAISLKTNTNERLRSPILVAAMLGWDRVANNRPRRPPHSCRREAKKRKTERT
jgi:hypothetical protein